MRRILEFKVRVTVEDNGKAIVAHDRDYMGDAVTDAINSYAQVGELTDPERPLEVENVHVIYPNRVTTAKE